MMHTGIKIESKIIKETASTKYVAQTLDIFFDNLSTIGLIEQAITNEAKNVKAISLHLKIKNIKINKTIVKVIFLKFMYLSKNFSSIITPHILQNL